MYLYMMFLLKTNYLTKHKYLSRSYYHNDYQKLMIYVYDSYAEYVLYIFVRFYFWIYIIAQTNIIKCNRKIYIKSHCIYTTFVIEWAHTSYYFWLYFRLRMSLPNIDNFVLESFTSDSLLTVFVVIMFVE